MPSACTAQSNLHAVRDGARIVRTLVRETPSRAARRAVPGGSPAGMHEGLLPTTSVLPPQARSRAPWVTIPEPRSELTPVVTLASEEILEPVVGAHHAR